MFKRYAVHKNQAFLVQLDGLQGTTGVKKKIGNKFANRNVFDDDFRQYFPATAPIFQFLGDYGPAKEYLLKALTIRKEIGDKQGEAIDYGILGAVFKSLGECVKEEEHFK